MDMNTPPPIQKQEMQAAPGGDMQQIMTLLNQILQKLGAGAETQDVSDLENATKAKVKESEPVMEHQGSGDMVAKSDDEGNKKNKEMMNEPGKVATADFASLQNEVKELRKKLELQDSEIPEFGGQNTGLNVEVADLGANGRREMFGEYGAWDACFNGKDSALKFKR